MEITFVTRDSRARGCKHLAQAAALGLLLLGGAHEERAQACEITNIPTGETFDYTLSLSADGNLVALTSFSDLVPGNNADGNQELFVYNVASDALTQITSTTLRSIEHPSMSGDGARIAFLSTGNVTGLNPDNSAEIFLFDAGNNSIVQITNTDTGDPFETFDGPSISADGSRLVFISRAVQNGLNTDENPEVFLYDVESSTLSQVTDTAHSPPELFIFNFTPSINADGTRIAFGSNGDLAGENADHFGELFVYDTGTSEFTQVTESADFYSSGLPSISGDGTRVAFVSSWDLTGENPDHDYQFFLYDFTAGSLTQITANDETGLSIVYVGAPALSGNGARVAFHSQTDLLAGQNADRTAEVYLYGVSNGSLAQVTSSDTRYSFPFSISADGTRIAFASGLSAGLAGLDELQFSLATCPNPQQAVGDLQETVEGLGLPAGLTTALLTKLQAALDAIAAGDISGACSNLKAFISQVKAQSGKKLTKAQADELIAEANAIRSDIGCPP